MEMGMMDRIYRRLVGKPTNFLVSPYGSSLLASCERVDLQAFIEELGMPDTFYTWYLVTELHVWMIAARLMSDGSPEAKEVRNAVIKMLWKECDQR